jgi:hypothetical protein
MLPEEVDPTNYPLITTYDMCGELIEWLSWNFAWIEQSAFDHWKGLQKLTSIVDAVEEGRAPMFAAKSAIRDHNETVDDNITYQEVRDRSSTYVYSPGGDPIAYIDHLQAARIVLESESPDFAEALEETAARRDIEWVLVYYPFDNVLVVLKSPHVVDSRFFLPPEIVSSFGSLETEELMHY